MPGILDARSTWSAGHPQTLPPGRLRIPHFAGCTMLPSTWRARRSPPWLPLVTSDPVFQATDASCCTFYPLSLQQSPIPTFHGDLVFVQPGQPVISPVG